MWIGLAPLGAANSIPATPAGTLLTTFQFHALAATSPSTIVNIVPSAGNPVGQTIVYDGTIPNTNVTGTLSSATITIHLACPPDADHDHVVNVNDLLVVIA